MTKEKKKFQQIESQTVCTIYKLLNRERLISFTLTDESVNKVDALVSNINSTYFGHELYKSNQEKAVAYLYFIIKNHPFTDGNKRTAALTFEVICHLNDLHPEYRDFSLDELAVFIEGYKTDDHQGFINDLAKIIFG
jgi:prophage maintenance system killer protein